MIESKYYTQMTAAYVRGKLEKSHPSHPLVQKDFGDLTIEDREELFFMGRREGLRMHRFKKTMELPRVNKILGILKGIWPSNLLDIGTGRGTFLWPLLNQFPHMDITCIDLLNYRVEDLNAVSRGGFENLEAREMDVRDMDFEDSSFEVVTALEVLEHIPDLEKAVSEIVRVARGFIILSVPSQEDDNPEHIHLLDQDRIRELFAAYSLYQIQFDYVLNHLIALVKM